MQKLQFILQPAWELTQSVLRSSSGIMTDSTYRSSPTRKRYFFVPSEESAVPAGSDKPRS